MTAKEKLLQALCALPEDASWDDALEVCAVLAKIERGLQQADTGQTISHEQIKEIMAKRLARKP